jgi:hypothetical protein
MLKKTLLSAVSTILVVISSQAGAAGPLLANPVLDEIALRRLVASETADIRSLTDLGEHLRSAGGRSPLAALPPGARMQFINSLEFNANGLTEYRYDVLRDNLTASQSYRILKLFGAEGSGSFLRTSRVETQLDAAIARLRMADDYDGARCISPGTCEKNWPNHICTSNC